MKEIPGFPDYEITKNGQIWSKLSDRFLKLNSSGDYLKVDLRVSQGKYKTRNVHVLVLATFILERPVGMQARHLDDNKKNNHIDNLKWGTAKENFNDAVKNNKRIRFGEGSPNSKLNELQARIIKKYPRHGGCLPYLSSVFGVSCQCISGISGIRSGFRWRHI